MVSIYSQFSKTHPAGEDRWHDHLLKAGTAIIRPDNGRIGKGVGVPFIGGSTDREVVIINCDCCSCSTNTSWITKFGTRGLQNIPNSPVKHVRSSEKQVLVD